MTYIMKYDQRNRNNLNQLGDNTKAAAYKWYQYCIDNQIEILIYETIRTKETQQQHVNNGASQTMKSHHLVGQALDFVPVVNGTLKWDGYGAANITKAVKKAKDLGFEWGGDWRSFVDKPHLQYNYKGYGTDTFTGKGAPIEPDTSNKVIPAKPNTNNNGSASTGDSTIKAIQTTLNKNYKTALAVDGYYGPKTKQALVKGLQMELNKQYNKKLSTDGIFGSKTKAACVVVEKNAKGNITYILQSTLYCQKFNPGKVDGIFGNKTEKAIRSFQGKKGLAVDGQAGPNTFEKLLK